MAECGDKHPTEDVRCQIKPGVPHATHWFKTPWDEHSWPNESFVMPQAPTGPKGRLHIRSKMVEMSQSLTRPHSYLRSDSHSTEEMAADLSKVKNSVRRRQVLHVIARANGITDDGIATVLDDPVLADHARTRRRELEEAGWVRVRVTDGQEVLDRTRSGLLARVWELTPSGEETLHLVDFSDL